MAPQYIASFDKNDTTTIIRTSLKEVLKWSFLRHNGTSTGIGAGTSVPAYGTCLDELPAALERVGDGALMLYRVGMRDLWRGS
ncbi:unnamed protein product [Prunus armeniaca]